MSRYIREEPASLDGYLESMARAIFSAGMNFEVIDAKWSATTKAFDGWKVKRVSAYSPGDIERLMTDPGVVHNRKKIEAIVANAGELIVVDRDSGGIKHYLESFKDNEELVKHLHKRFGFLGESVAHFFLFGVGFNLPAQEKWAKQHFGAEAYAHHAAHHH